MFYLNTDSHQKAALRSATPINCKDPIQKWKNCTVTMYNFSICCSMSSLKSEASGRRQGPDRNAEKITAVRASVTVC